MVLNSFLCGYTLTCLALGLVCLFSDQVDLKRQNVRLQELVKRVGCREGFESAQIA